MPLLALVAPLSTRLGHMRRRPVVACSMAAIVPSEETDAASVLHCMCHHGHGRHRNCSRHQVKEGEWIFPMQIPTQRPKAHDLSQHFAVCLLFIDSGK